MPAAKKYHIDQLRDYSSLFSRSEVKRWIRNDFSSLDAKISRYRDVKSQKCTYLSYLKQVYSILGSHYPNEYIYKNEFLSQWLIKELGREDSVIFSEFKLDKAVADLAMFNGISKVFEIKTLLDQEARLSTQLEQYERLFNEINLIVPAVKAEQYLKYSNHIGVIVYHQSERQFKLIRKAQYRMTMDVDLLMQVLHTHEYVSLVSRYFGTDRMMNDFNKFQICKDLISQIPPAVLNTEFISLMKQRRSNYISATSHKQLNQLFLAMNYSKNQRQQLLHHLNTAIH